MFAFKQVYFVPGSNGRRESEKSDIGKGRDMFYIWEKKNF